MRKIVAGLFISLGRVTYVISSGHATAGAPVIRLAAAGPVVGDEELARVSVYSGVL
jgi:hypothetical protein